MTPEEEPMVSGKVTKYSEAFKQQVIEGEEID